MNIQKNASWLWLRLVIRQMSLNLPIMLRLFLYNAKWCKDYWNLNPVMLVFIGWRSLSTLKWVPMCQGSVIFRCLCLYLLANLATSSLRVYAYVSVYHSLSTKISSIASNLHTVTYARKNVKHITIQFTDDWLYLAFTVQYDGPSVKEKIFKYVFSPPYFGGRKYI